MLLFNLIFFLENVLLPIIFNLTREYFLQTGRHDEFSKILFLNGPGYSLLENVLIPIIFCVTREYFFTNL